MKKFPRLKKIRQIIEDLISFNCRDLACACRKRMHLEVWIPEVPPSRNLQQVMGYEQDKERGVWWHTGESELVDTANKERVRYKFWERFYIPEWLPFRELD